MYLPVCLPSCTKKNDPNEWFPDDIFSDHIKYKALAGVKNKVFLTQNKEESPGPHWTSKTMNLALGNQIETFVIAVTVIIL